MQNLTKVLIIILGILFTISYCEGDTCICICCAGNFCKPTLQGNITVASCTSSSCESACQLKYPTQCTDGRGSANYQCRSGGGGGSTPDWIGVFTMGNNCDTRICCCPVGQMRLSPVNTNTLHVYCPFSGNGCPSGPFSLDQTISMPTGFDIQISFIGNTIDVSLSDDNRRIFFSNPDYPQCNEVATRSGGSFSARINLVSIFLLIGLITFQQFMF